MVKLKEKKIPILAVVLLLSALLLPLINAEGTIQTLGTFKQGECIELKQLCSNCSNVNITSMLYPNSTIAFGNVEMTKDGTDYNYTTCLTSQLGNYIVNGLGDPNGVISVWVYNFVITPSGTNLSTSNGLLYTIFMIILIGVFGFVFYGALSLPFKNSRSELGYIIGINDLKYVKIFLLALSYVLLMSIFGLARGITANFLTEIGIYRVFNWLFWIMLSFLWPIIVLSLLFMLILFFEDKKLKKELERGAWFQ